jgi:hypothetical protein
MRRRSVCFRSSLSLIHAVIFHGFYRNVHHRRLSTEAAYGCLKPVPTNRLRRAVLHLGYSITLASVFMAQHPLEKFRACLPPEALKTAGGDAGVVDGVLGVAVAKIILD